MTATTTVRDPPRADFLGLLPPADREALLASAERVSFKLGEKIVREGEPADSFYVLVSGRARAVKLAENGEDVSLGSIAPGEVFGEVACLRGGARSATVRASADVTALRFDRHLLDALFARRPALRTWLEGYVRTRLLATFLKQGTLFSELPAAELKAVASALEPVSVAKGEAILRQGDPAGALYVVESGRLRVDVAGEGRSLTVAYLSDGDVFGEQSLLKGQPRSATVVAVSACKLLALPPAAFRTLCEASPAFVRAVDARIATFEYGREARLPLGFTEEALPAQARKEPAVPAAEQEHEHEHEGAFADQDGHFKKKKARWRFPFIHQVDEMDCGPACLAMICRHFGRRVSLTRIREVAHTASDGTSLNGLCRAAVELGLAARSARVSKRNTDLLPLPAIIHWDNFHWVVLVDLTKTEARIADPGSGDRWIPRSELEAKWNGYAALFDYTDAFEKTPESKPSFGWIASLARPYRGTLLKSLGLAVVAAWLTLLVPILSQVVVDRVLVDGATAVLEVVVLALLGTFLLLNGAKLLQGYILAFVALRVDGAALDLLTRRLLALPTSYFHTRRTGDIERRLDGVRQLRELAVSSGVQALLAAVQLAIALVIMAVYSPLLMLAFVAHAPLYALAMLYLSRRLKPLVAQLEESFGKYKSDQIDAIRGFEAVKAGGGEHALRESLLGRFLDTANLQFKADYSVLGYQGAISAIGFLSSVVFLWLGARLAIRGDLTLGGFIAFNALVAQANAPIGVVLGLWDRVQVGRVLFDRVSDLFEYEPEQGSDRSRLLPVPTLAGNVEFRGVGFRYGGPESPWIVHDFSLDVPAGKTVAIVGRSGAGKTTLVKLLAGLIEPSEGSILLDGVDLKTLNYREVRRHLGYVLQENYMFSDTILKNIAFGEEADVERATSAARAAAASEFVERLPLGYHTRIGESGLCLSGGQKQRIAIARALYRQPAIVIFDEATSALDTESERLIQENMKTLLAGRTAFVIAHRLSTVRDADLIVVLEKGEIVEKGTHDELMERRGIYFYLACHQSVDS